MEKTYQYAIRRVCNNLYQIFVVLADEILTNVVASCKFDNHSMFLRLNIF